MKNILALVYSLVIWNLICYVDGSDGNGGWGSDAWEGDQWWNSNNDSEGGQDQGQGNWQGQDPGAWNWGWQEWNSPHEKFKRWKLMNERKSESQNKAPDNNPKNMDSWKELMNDPDFSEFINSAFEKNFSQFWDKFSKIDSIEKQFETQEFLKQFSEAWKPYAEAGLNIDTNSVIPLIQDIETKGLTPEMIILIQNKDMIFEKLKLLPRQNMSSDDGRSVPNNGADGKTMVEKEASLRKKWWLI